MVDVTDEHVEQALQAACTDALAAADRLAAKLDQLEQQPACVCPCDEPAGVTPFTLCGGLVLAAVLGAVLGAAKVALFGLPPSLAC